MRLLIVLENWKRFNVENLTFQFEVQVTHALDVDLFGLS